MAIHKLVEMCWMEVDNLNREKNVALLPISPVEAHGPHLPLGTDIFCATDIAQCAANILMDRAPDIDVILGPPIPLGCAGSAADFPGTISLRGRTLKHLVVDVLGSFVDHGFNNILLVNHHLEPIHMKAILSAIDKFSAHRHVRIAEVCSRVVYAGVKTDLADVIKEMGLDMHTELHADVKETSFIKRYYPELLKLLYKELPPVLIDTRKCRSEGRTTFKQMGAERGYMGSPAAAQDDLGRRHLEAYGEMTAELSLKLIGANPLPEMNPKVVEFLKNHVVLD